MIWKKKKDASAEAAETAEAKSGVSAFAKKNWKWLVPVVCVVIAGGVFLLKPKSASTTAVDPSYLEASPEVRDVSNTLSGTGTLNPANTYTVKSLVEGKVLRRPIEDAKKQKVSTLIDCKVMPKTMVHGYGDWWRVGIAQVSKSKKIHDCYENLMKPHYDAARKY